MTAQKCPSCGRVAYMPGGRCEFCGVGTDAEYLYETPLEQQPRARGRCPSCGEFGMTTQGVCEKCGYRVRELLPDSLFTRLDRAQSTLMDAHRFLSQRASFQHEAAELARVAEQLASFTKGLARGE